MPDYETLKLAWWLVVGALLIGFAVMDGHDLGVGALLWLCGCDAPAPAATPAETAAAPPREHFTLPALRRARRTHHRHRGDPTPPPAPPSTPSSTA